MQLFIPDAGQEAAVMLCGKTFAQAVAGNGTDTVAGDLQAEPASGGVKLRYPFRSAMVKAYLEYCCLNKSLIHNFIYTKRLPSVWLI